MREVAQGVEMKEARRALEGVKGAKDEWIVVASAGFSSSTRTPCSMPCNSSKDSPWNSRRSPKSSVRSRQIDGSSAPEGKAVVALPSLCVALPDFSVRAQPSGQAGIAVPVCQDSNTDVIQACHSLKLRMVSLVELAWSVQHVVQPRARHLQTSS